MSIVEKGAQSDLYAHRYAVNKEATGPLIAALRAMLADSVTVYHMTHGFHWNVKGGAYGTFAQYHALFGDVYADVYESVDPTAESLLKLGVDAPYTLASFMALRTVEDREVISDPLVMAAVLYDALDGLLATLNATFAQANAANEQGIANFVAERIDATQKWLWQLGASLTPSGMDKSLSPVVKHPGHDQASHGRKGGGGGGGSDVGDTAAAQQYASGAAANAKAAFDKGQPDHVQSAANGKANGAAAIASAPDRAAAQAVHDRALAAYNRAPAPSGPGDARTGAYERGFVSGTGGGFKARFGSDPS